MDAPQLPLTGFSGPVEDRLAIRELVDAYGDAVARRDADAWIRTWAPQGRWLIRGAVLAGHAELRRTWLAAMAAHRFVSFQAQPGAIAVQGSAARMRVHTTEWLVPLEGPARLQHGCYEDQLVREAGRWQFAERSFTVLSTQPF